MIVQPSSSQINVSLTSHSSSKSTTQSNNKFNNQVLDNSPFRITTLNVRGINASSKIDLIINLIKKDSIHILELVKLIYVHKQQNYY
jgi:hypothetical protein